MKRRRILSGLCALTLLTTLLVQPALAATGTLSSDELPTDVITVDDVGGLTLEDIDLRTSEAGIALIKEFEGFSETAYWDYSQYSIGYGTACEEDSYPDGITEAEADLLLREVLLIYEAALDAYLDQYGITVSQQQYDALMSFTYNNGSGWMDTNCKLTQCLRRGVENCSDEEIMNAFGPWCHVNSSSILPALARRRIVEAQVFLYGSYTNSATSFYYVIFDANGGELAGSQEDILYFQYGSSLDTLDLFYMEIDQIAEQEGHTFCGWRTAAYKELTDRSAVTGNMTVYAMWDENTTTETLPAASSLDGWSEGFTDTTLTDTTPSKAEPEVVEVSFTDVSDSDWYAEAVTYVVQNGLLSGTSETEFSPESPMTRAMFVTALANLTGVDLNAYGVPNYSDVSASDWYCQAVSWASQCGLITGYTDGSFGPDDALTREQMCTILLRYTQLVGTVLPQTTAAVTFPDESEISSYALEAVSACQQAGLISGRTSGVFDPQGTLQRCEAAKVLMLFHQLFA